MLMSIARRAPGLLQTIARQTRLSLSAAGSPCAALTGCGKAGGYPMIDRLRSLHLSSDF
jgi:hypothetical protein